MLHFLYFTAVSCFLCFSPVKALPQLPSSWTTSPSATTSITPQSKSQPTLSAASNNHTCEFNDMQAFFNYANREKLNITVEVQNCQNLCLLSYGVGNPDLSGIGMMYSYTIQLGLTLFVGPAYRLIYLSLFPKKDKNSKKMPLFTAFVLDLQHVQDLFFASNGVFILASAVASLVSLADNPAIFEIAEMQSLAFLQINSIMVIFFCLVDSLSLFNPRVWLHAVVFVVVIVVLGKSQLSSSRRTEWRHASEGCVHNDATDYEVITPVPYPPWAVAVFGIVGMTGFWITTLKERFQGSKARVRIFKFIFSIWILLILLMVGGMGLGITMMWRQRKHLRSVAGEKFEDDTWGFGQVAALFVWAPIPLRVLGVFHRCAQGLKDGYWKNPVVKYFLFGKDYELEN